MAAPSQTPTELLIAWGNGEREARNRLMPLVYDELRRLAARYMRSERQGHTLQATALVNEVYLRLVQSDRVQLQSRAHFFALAARMMRRMLVDAARARGNAKRGGGIPRVSLDNALDVADKSPMDFVALDSALVKLESVHPRKMQVVELRVLRRAEPGGERAVARHLHRHREARLAVCARVARSRARGCP